jgi:hypothetical protein
LKGDPSNFADDESAVKTERAILAIETPMGWNREQLLVICAGGFEFSITES